MTVVASIASAVGEHQKTAAAPHFEFSDPFTGAPLSMDGAAPLAPPDEWFSQEAADEAPEKITVFPGGRVAGVVAPAGRCLLNGSSECWMIPKPRSQSELDLAHTGQTVTASGQVIKTGVLAGGGGHAKEWASPSVAQKHYADTNTQLMRGVYRWSDKAGGLTFVGAVWPEVTPRQIAEINASPASIDYRWIDDEQEHRLVGATLVNIGGLPTRWRASRTAAAVILIPERAPAFVAALGESEGTMIALRIDAPQFELPGGMPAEQMHVTLAYFGKAAQYDPTVRSAAVGLVGEAVAAFGLPMLLEVSAVGVLGPPEEPVVGLLLQGESLPGLRELAKSAGEAAGLRCDDTYPVFTPHITVGPYPGNLDAALALRGMAVSPPSVVVAFGSEDWTEFELPRVGRPLEVETYVESEDLMGSEPVTADAESWRKWREDNPTEKKDREPAKQVSEHKGYKITSVGDKHQVEFKEKASGNTQRVTLNSKPAAKAWIDENEKDGLIGPKRGAVESPAMDEGGANVPPIEGAAMTCECGKTKTAASPIEADMGLGEESAGSVSPEAFAELSARVEALESAIMASEMAALASADVKIPSY